MLTEYLLQYQLEADYPGTKSAEIYYIKKIKENSRLRYF